MATDELNGVSMNMERYLEAAYRLADREEFISVSEIAKFLHVAPASVSEMVKKLAEGGYLEHKPYHGVKLTPQGRHIGGESVRRHRLAERLLTDLLGATPEQAHEEAYKLEGFLRGEIENRVLKALGYPQTCPHGNPMDVGSVEDAIPLAEMEGEGVTYRIAKIRYDTPDFLNYLKGMELVPGSTVAVQKREPFGGPTALRVNEDQEHQVGEMVLSHIWVFPPEA